MPTVNSAGQIIPDAKRTPEEEKRLLEIKGLEWPEDRDKISRLHCRSFFQWLYGLEPRTAVMFAYSPDFQKILKRQRRKINVLNFFGRWMEKIWR